MTDLQFGDYIFLTSWPMVNDNTHEHEVKSPQHHFIRMGEYFTHYCDVLANVGVYINNEFHLQTTAFLYSILEWMQFQIHCLIFNY